MPTAYNHLQYFLKTGINHARGIWVNTYVYSMNLLFDFIKHLQPAEKEVLRGMVVKGRSAQVWDMINRQASGTGYNRELIQQELGITQAHFDKIT